MTTFISARPRVRLFLIAAFLVVLALPARLTAAHAASTTTYTATETIPVPPASTYAGSGGGDGWGIALSATDVYNVFHHSSVLQVACHLQSDASPCWSPETITDASGDNFATSGQPGLWLDQKTGRLYAYATRTSDSTGGVVCIDTGAAATNPDPFCGFTALTAVGESPTNDGISFLSDPIVVGTRWYSFNFVSGTSVSGTQNKLLCFDLTTLSPCGSQPFAVSIGTGDVSDVSFPPPATAAIGNQVIIPVTVGGTDELACFNGTSLGDCAGSWPIALSFSYDSSYGAPFPMMTAAGVIDGLCLPGNGDPCFSLSGATVSAPGNMTSVIPGTSGWNGPAFVLGPRVYVPDGNRDQVECFDYGTGTSCENFPKTLANLGLLYTVNADPQRPTCIWVNSDDGGGQIQNFDAYTAGGCGQGPIRVLASSLVAPTQLCVPYSYTSLQVLDPARTSYTDGTVTFEDGDANPIAGTPALPLDNTGAVSLTGLNLNTSQGLPQFLITLNGASGTPSSVKVQLTWTGVSDPSCSPIGSPPAKRKVIVFIGGVCTATDASTGYAVGDVDKNGNAINSLGHNTFYDIQQKLLFDYGYKSSDFLAYSYKGGTMKDINGSWQWFHNSYAPMDPVTSDWTANDPALLDSMLQQYQEKYPNTEFVLVGHSLGGVVAFQEEWNNVLHPTSVHANPYQIVTIDSPLHGITPSVILHSALLSLGPQGWPVPGCAIKGQAAFQLDQRYLAEPSTTQLLSEVADSAVEQQGAARIDNFGNNWDCVMGPQLCGIPSQGDVKTQWITGTDATEHAYTDKEDCTSLAVAITSPCVGETHGALLLDDVSAMQDIVDAIGPQQ